MKKLIVLIFLLGGCSNAKMSAVGAWSKPHHIRCYSGELKIYDGHSTGKIENEASSDGYYFEEKESGKIVLVSGNCLITLD